MDIWEYINICFSIMSDKNKNTLKITKYLCFLFPCKIYKEIAVDWR